MVDSFFLDRARGIDISTMGLSPLVEKVWWRRVNRANAKPNSHQRYIAALSDITGLNGTREQKQSMKILDVGAGVGVQIFELAGAGAECTGIDNDPQFVNLVRNVSIEANLNIKAMVGDAHQLPFDSGYFDVVMSFQIFEHLADFDIAMREQIRVLKPGGRLIIEQADLLSALNLYDFLIKVPLLTHGKVGGLKWLFNRGQVITDIYKRGWDGKDEDIHSRLWWRRKMNQYPEVEVIEMTSFLEKMWGKPFRLLEPVFGNIIIIAVKKGVL